MKTKFFLSAIMMVAGMTLFAQTPPPHTYDFAVPNSKGDTIWYLITSPQTVAVSFRCDSAFKWVVKYEVGLNGLYPTKRNWYQGDLVVPDRVIWTMFFLASAMPLRIASETSEALPRP